MKHLKTILVVALAVAFLIVGVAMAETGRLGKLSGSYTFNKTTTAYKTAAYTLTTSDSAVNSTASSANIVATLPSVSDALSSGKRVAYLIRKKDATTYKIVVTPASGDTIGGESTRYLVGDESYVVIHAGPRSEERRV